MNLFIFALLLASIGLLAKCIITDMENKELRNSIRELSSNYPDVAESLGLHTKLRARSLLSDNLIIDIDDIDNERGLVHYTMDNCPFCMSIKTFNKLYEVENV